MKVSAKRPVDLIFPDKRKLKEEGKCPTCKLPIKDADFVDRLSRREFEISGMCQKCQDEIFNEDEGTDR
jgi:hypothetical protein